MPETLGELLWQALSALSVVSVGLVGWIANGIRNELKELKQEIRVDRRYSRWLVNVVMIMRTRCAMLHPGEAMPPMPEAPGED